MKKKYADFKLGVPDYVTVETEDERLVCQMCIRDRIKEREVYDL